MVLLSKARFSAVPFAVVVVLAGCGGGGGGGGGGGSSSTPHPAGAPGVLPATVKITAVASPVTVSVGEVGYGGAFAVNAAPCAGIASVAAAGVAGSFTITGIAPGSCAVTFTDTFAQSVAVPVTVTTSDVTAK
ncbi:MAG: hypothetical protein QOF71_1260 [Candidatus Eremiobacteraeota bacterium]|jgi:hypothetical protein|nr:hypothetical protein [Candidatus Eremiobacteraeota bacterium]